MAQRHRENAIIPLILYAGDIKVTANRIETEMIVCERPHTILSQTVHMQTVID